MRTGIERIAVAIFILVLMVITLNLPMGLAETLDGRASVSGSECVLVSAEVDTTTVDPESYFRVNVRVRDEDTLADIENVVVKVFSDDTDVDSQDERRNHYTFWFDPSDETWHTTMTNVQGDPFIDPAGSEHPADISDVEDNYSFRILLNGTANPNVDWNLYAEVSDGESTDSNETETGAFSVNEYIHYDVREDSVEWNDLEPGTERNPASNNPITVENIETNIRYNIRTKLEGNWTDSEGNSITVTETSFESDDPDGFHGFVHESFEDVYSNMDYGEGLTGRINYFLTVPADTVPGIYINTFAIEVVEYYR